MRGVASALLGVEGEITMLDMEASIEHLSRATPQGADALLVVVEPYYRALETAGRIAPLARELEIPRLLAVANKIRDDEDARVIRDYCRSHQLELVAEIPYDESVREADRYGLALIDHAPEAESVNAMRSLAEQLT